MKRFAGLSIVAAALSDDPRESPSLARGLGASGMLFDSIIGSTDLTSLSGTGRREFRNLLERNGQTLVALRANVGSRGLAPKVDIDQILSRAAQVLEAARGLVCPLVCVDLGALPASAEESKPIATITPEQAGVIIIPTLDSIPDSPKGTQTQPAAPVDEKLLAHVDSALSALGELAERYSIHLALSSALSNMAAIERAMKSVRCPWFAIDLDPSAILRDRWDMDTLFSRLGNKIIHVTARDAALGADKRTQPAIIGHGDVDWRALLGALESADYRGWLTIDPMQLPAPRAGAVRGVEYLRQLKHATRG